MATSAPALSIALVADVGLPLLALQALAEAVFGAGGRAPGWFARKLVREAVDPQRSVLALGPGDMPVGYLLVGTEPGEAVAHSAGLGVLPGHRGCGLGSSLIARAVQALQIAEVPALQLLALQLLALPSLRGFYERREFTAGAGYHTLLGVATGRKRARELDFAAHAPAPWPLPGTAIAGWRAGTWSRTPSQDAATVALTGGAWAHLSREGRAILIQRLCVADERGDRAPADAITRTHAALDDLRGRFSRGTPLLLYGCEAVSCVTASLLRSGQWQVAQTAVEMQRRLRQGVDKHAGPTA